MMTVAGFYHMDPDLIEDKPLEWVLFHYQMIRLREQEIMMKSPRLF